MNDKENRSQDKGGSVLDWALHYHKRGWSIIPIKAGTKEPCCRWKTYQKQRPDLATLRRWFRVEDGRGIAVVCGEVSGGVVVRDFDVMEGYRQWASEHPDLAETLPTVATARGRHVYFRAPDDENIVHLEDGELRGAGYCLLPPSPHPAGPRYRWLIDLPEGELPIIDPRAAGLLTDVTERTQRTQEHPRVLRSTESTEAMVGDPIASDGDPLSDPDVLQTVHATIPQGIGSRHRQVFELARALKAIPHLADADPGRFAPVVRRWHTLGRQRGVVGTESWEESLIDFLQSWPRIKYPKGTDPMSTIFARARAAELPAVAEKYESEGIRLLVRLCAELQTASGKNPFFLATRTAGRLLGVQHVRAWRWLWLLAHDGIIAEVEKGAHATRRASRWRYLGG